MKRRAKCYDLTKYIETPTPKPHYLIFNVSFLNKKLRKCSLKREKRRKKCAQEFHYEFKQMSISSSHGNAKHGKN